MSRRGPLRLAALAVVVALFAVMFLGSPLLWAGVPPVAVGLLVVGVFLAALWYGFRRRSDGTVWDAIPSWQYTGRHVESGGLTRDEQERALRDVREQAEQRDRD